MEPDLSSATPVVCVIADDRETKSGVVSELGRIDGVHLIVRRLKEGDYEVDGRCLFERKTLVDFANSIKDGRLFVQAHRMRKSHLPFALILEGRSSNLEATGMRREALQGAMISLSLIFEVPVLRSLEASETARLLIYAANQLRRMQTGAVTLHMKRPKRRRKIQLQILQGLPGIGPGRAEDLLDHFGSVAAVITAEQCELESIQGIGEKTAAAIRWALQKD